MQLTKTLKANLFSLTTLFLFSWSATAQENLMGEIVCEGRYAHHLQGVCSDGRSLFWSFTTSLVKTDLKGKMLLSIPVANHHGDLCYREGMVYVAVNLGLFNHPDGKADSWVFVYDAQTLKETKRHEVQEVFHGAGGIGHHNGRFLIVGGLPDAVEENYVYEYDQDFSFLERHTIRSGHTHLGIQTATFAHDRWWFGCYGTPKILLVTDSNFRMIGRYEYDCSLGIECWSDGKLLSAAGACAGKDGCDGRVFFALPDERNGLVFTNPK